MVTEQVQAVADAGLAGIWAAQIFGYDALTLLSVVGSRVPDIELGTAVVPIYGRHPQVMAQQALTVQASIGNRLTLGIGPLPSDAWSSTMWGLPFDDPARYMAEYLRALVPMLARRDGQRRRRDGHRASPRPRSRCPGPTPPPVLVAALGRRCSHSPAEVADGTVTWMTGTAPSARTSRPDHHRGGPGGRAPGPPGGGRPADRP